MNGHWQLFDPVTNREHRFDSDFALTSYLRINGRTQLNTMSVWWEPEPLDEEDE